jgi:hypothetical protein
MIDKIWAYDFCYATDNMRLKYSWQDLATKLDMPSGDAVRSLYNRAKEALKRS